MRFYLYDKVYIIILLLIIFTFKIYSEKTTIHFILKQSDMPIVVDEASWERNYQDSINEFLKKKY